MKLIGLAAAGVLLLSQTTMAANTNAWDNTIAAGLNVTSGNSDTLTANGSIKSEKIGDVHEIRLSAEINYGENDTDDNGRDKSTDNSKAVFIYKYKLGGPYLYTDNSIFHDSMADIDYRIIAGGGSGFFLIESDDIQLGIEAGLAYVYEKMDAESGDGNISARLAARHDQKLSDSSKLWLTAEYIPSFEDSGDYLMNAEAGIEASINTSLSLRFVVQDRYDADVPDDRENNDVAVISSLVYKL
jgi:putative salt-induced outer membrane protein YdiY